MRSLWADRKPVLPDAWKDTAAVLVFGPDPAWSPDREYRHPEDADGLPFSKCLVCGYQSDDRPGAIKPGSHLVCARCYVYGRDVLMTPGRPIPEPKPAKGKKAKPAASPTTGYIVKGGIHVPEKYARLMKD